MFSALGRGILEAMEGRFFGRLQEIGSGAWIAVAAFVILGGASAAAMWYGYTRLEALSGQVAALQNELSSTTETLNAKLADATTSITSALTAQGQSVAAVKQDLGGIATQVGSLGGTVGTLEKLSQIDPHLLEKYSKVYFLSENYVPASLTNLPDQYKYFNNRTEQFLTSAYPFLANMLTQAANDHVDLYVASAYRSFSDQANLKSAYKVTYGSGANTFSADQGYSEHQLGTAVDLITTGMNGQLTQSFDQTTAYQWLVDNAYKYGFVLSYPKGNSYYIYEPWHWRFVGVKLATDLHAAGKYFYDLDQNTINTYLISIFD